MAVLESCQSRWKFRNSNWRSFYTDAGLTADITGNVARLRCPIKRDTRWSWWAVPRESDCIHVALRAENLAGISAQWCRPDGKIVGGPADSRQPAWGRGSTRHVDPLSQVPLMRARGSRPL